MDNLVIGFDGSAKELRLSLTFDSQFVSNKDWLLQASVGHKGLNIPQSEINWSYSAKLDVNYSYIEVSEAGQLFLPMPLICNVPFDEVTLGFLPWSPLAKAAASVPTFVNCRYAVRSRFLTGENVGVDTHILGQIRNGAAS